MDDADDSRLIGEARSLFASSFGTRSDSCAVVFAPGRVNLIGEHTDYNGGFVMPVALRKKTVVVGRGGISVHNDSVCRIASSAVGKVESFKADESLAPGEVEWANYIKGVVAAYQEDVPAGHYLHFDAAIASNIRLGGGLSSSAALEVSMATFLEEITGIRIGGVKKALRCQSSDVCFMKTPCGIMDQFVSALAKGNSALLVDCRNNEFEMVPLVDPDVVFVVADTGIKHKNSDGKYAERVQQCREAVEAIKKRHAVVHQLRDASLAWVKEIEGEVDEKVFRRARHVVTEDRRTLCCAMALRRKAYAMVGSSMCESHTSLRDDYEVSIPELDRLVSIAMEVDGVYGSRMTGGGFGGCTVTLVKREASKTLMKILRQEYLKYTSRECDCFITQACSGTGVMAPLRGWKKRSPATFIAYALVGAATGILAALALSRRSWAR